MERKTLDGGFHGDHQGVSVPHRRALHWIVHERIYGDLAVGCEFLRCAWLSNSALLGIQDDQPWIGMRNLPRQGIGRRERAEVASSRVKFPFTRKVRLAVRHDRTDQREQHICYPSETPWSCHWRSQTVRSLNCRSCVS